jgi:hypothetical protein
MPFVGGSPDYGARTLALIQMIQDRRERQGKSKLALAKPGDTIESLGIDEKTFQALYGKNAKYDPKMVVSEETASHRLDKILQSHLDAMTPVQLADTGATLLNREAGTPGATTVAGAEAARQAGGVAAATKLTQAQTGKVTAEDVARRTIEGIESWKRAPVEAQEGLNQTLAMGATSKAMEVDQFKNQLATSGLKQAIIAQTDPNHPIHGFLKKLDLNLNTVLAGTAMGITTMFDDYNRYWQQMSLANKADDTIFKRMYADNAKQMSEQIFKGKLTPGQVLTIMKSREEGTALPAGMENAAKVYDLAVQANFDASMQEQLNKGDPFLAGAQQALSNLGKITDGRQLEATQDLTRTIAAYAATVQQMGRPTTAEETARFDALMAQNKKRAISSGVNIRSFLPNTYTTQAPGQGGAPPPIPSGLPDAVSRAMQPRGGSNINPAALPGGGLNLNPVGGSGNPMTDAVAGLSDEDKAVLTQYLQSIGGLPGTKPKVPPT